VKNLREHIESIEVMGLLRQDIVDYFKAGATKKTAFLEKFTEYSHLLDEEHKLMLSQLTVELRALPNVHVLDSKTRAYDKQKGRTSAQIGTGHVDNTQGELKALKTPKFEEAGAFKSKFEKKVIDMIDGLILHLKNSRDALTKAEIKAGEDFAIFQNNMFKENKYLSEKIKELSAHLVDLKAQLSLSQQQLTRRETLRKQAEEKLKHLRQMKREKIEYCKRETTRRTKEIGDVASAQTIFQNVLDKLSLRVKLRTQDNVEGKKYAKGLNHEKHVAKAKKNTEAGLSAREKERNAIAYY